MKFKLLLLEDVPSISDPSFYTHFYGKKDDIFHSRIPSVALWLHHLLQGLLDSNE
jgi:hypothetical protein